LGYLTWKFECWNNWLSILIVVNWKTFKFIRSRKKLQCLSYPVYLDQIKGVSMARMAVACLSRYVGCGPERIRSRSCLVPRRINPPVIDEYLRRMVITCETSYSAFGVGHLNCTSLYDKELFLNKCTSCTLKIYNISGFNIARENGTKKMKKKCFTLLSIKTLIVIYKIFFHIIKGLFKNFTK